ncbi:MAG: alpha/beta hydrolase, partial [Propionibacteriales bacterium]|nr:alpha/beta hydrolase [Propionibacteriales bacterium]
GVANEIGDQLAGLTYVSAFCCTELASPLDYLIAPEARLGAAAPSAPTLSEDQTARVPAGTTRHNWRSDDPAFLASARAQLMGDASEEEFLAAIASAQQPDESTRASVDDARVRPATWGQVPRAYVRLTQDRLNTPALQDRMIAEADRAAPDHRFVTVDIATSHLGVHTRAAELAAHLHTLWP